MNNPDTFCSLNSEAMGEPLYGTAVHVGVWFLLEYRAPWAPKTTNDNDLPEAVQTWLAEQVTSVPKLADGANGRLQFIKQGKDRTELAFFVAVMTGVAPIVYEFALTAYEDLFAIDVAAVIAGAADYEANRRAEPLYFVCTHGKRDLCCAKFGMAFYNQLTAQVGNQAWQASHLGGHRFAVTVLTLPNGVNYGRLQPDDIPDLIAAQAQDSLLLHRLRGQTRYAPLVQTADFYLRQQTRQYQNNAFVCDDVMQTAPDQWRVSFRDQHNEPHHIQLVQDEHPIQILASCGKPKMKTFYPYRLVAVPAEVGG